MGAFFSRKLVMDEQDPLATNSCTINKFNYKFTKIYFDDKWYTVDEYLTDHFIELFLTINWNKYDNIRRFEMIAKSIIDCRQSNYKFKVTAKNHRRGLLVCVVSNKGRYKNYAVLD
jgi:hypothetical protein